MRSAASGLIGLMEMPEVAAMRFGWSSFSVAIRLSAPSLPEANSMPA
jgi:hypothetical protein